MNFDVNMLKGAEEEWNDMAVHVGCSECNKCMPC